MKSGSGNTNTKLILLHSYIQKQTSTTRLLLLAFVYFFTIVFLLTPIYLGVPSTHCFSDVLRRCAPPCNLLVFGLTHETLLWKSLNHNGRTVFIEENRYYAAYFEEIHHEIDVFDVQHTTKAHEAEELVAVTKEAAGNECRPVQNLLFSDCKLGLNDLPNHVYDVDWDIIFVDGPRVDAHDGPGRMSSTLTAAVVARKTRNPKTHVFVHDNYRDVERLCGDEERRRRLNSDSSTCSLWA